MRSGWIQEREEAGEGDGSRQHCRSVAQEEEYQLEKSRQWREKEGEEKQDDQDDSVSC